MATSVSGHYAPDVHWSGRNQPYVACFDLISQRHTPIRPDLCGTAELTAHDTSMHRCHSGGPYVDET
eukprot:1117097-Rhodomonas_salina.2